MAQQLAHRLAVPARRARGFTLALNPNVLTMSVLFATIVLWASAFTGIRVGLEGYTPEQLAFLRYLIASALLAVYAVVTRMPLPRLRDVPGLFVVGFIGFTVYNVALNAGEQSVPAATASFIISSEIGMIAVMATFFLGERLRAVNWLGVVLCMAGIAVISFSGGGGLEASSGALLVLLATLAISVYSIMQKPFLRRYSPIQFTAYAIWAGTACLFFFAPNTLSVISVAPLNATLAAAYLGIFPGVVAYVAWAFVLSRIPASRAGSYLAMIPVAALVIAWLFLGEMPHTVALLGGAVVLTGIVLVNRRAADRA